MMEKRELVCDKCGNHRKLWEVWSLKQARKYLCEECKKEI